MNTNRIYKGTIIINYTHFQDALLLKYGEGFINLDSINSMLSLKKNVDNRSIPVYYTKPNQVVYIDESTLVPYYKKTRFKTLRKIKKELK